MVKAGEVCVSTSKGSSVRVTDTGGRAEHLAWLPSGKRVLFSKSGSASVYWVDVSTRKSGTLALDELPSDEASEFMWRLKPSSLA